MALILEKIYRRVLVNKDISEKCIKLLKLQRISDRLSKYLPVETLVAHKTGLERGICHDVGLVFTGEGDFLIAVLTKHANSNSAPSKEFIAKVALHTYAYFEDLSTNSHYSQKEKVAKRKRAAANINQKRTHHLLEKADILTI